MTQNPAGQAVVAAPPFQAVPLLTGGPILILTTAPDQASFGNQPMVCVYQPQGVAPRVDGSPPRQYQMTDSPRCERSKLVAFFISSLYLSFPPLSLPSLSLS